jgi:hypothetical protein
MMPSMTRAALRHVVHRSPRLNHAGAGQEAAQQALRRAQRGRVRAPGRCRWWAAPQLSM